MGFYERLGVRRIINAGTASSALGGTLPPPEVLDAMRDAAGSLVDLHELHLAAGRRLAELTGNDAAHVTSGCAAALVLGVLAARTCGDLRLIGRMPDAPGVPDEVIVHAAHRSPYDPAVRLAGASIRQIGNALQTFDWELEAAITERTAAVLYVAGRHLARGALPLEEVVGIAHEHQVPVIVDAAAQLPPVENLWRFTVEAGADLAVFSGGTALHGPQASGLMVGRADLVEAARRNGAPYQRLARPLKVGKEEIAGLVTAVERYLRLDHRAQAMCREETVSGWLGTLTGLPGVTAHREPYDAAGRPVPQVRLVFGRARAAATPEAVVALLRSGGPAIAVLPDETGFWIGPGLLRPGEAGIVGAAIRRLLCPATAGELTAGRSRPFAEPRD